MLKFAYKIAKIHVFQEIENLIKIQRNTAITSKFNIKNTDFRVCKNHDFVIPLGYVFTRKIVVLPFLKSITANW